MRFLKALFVTLSLGLAFVAYPTSGRAQAAPTAGAAQQPPSTIEAPKGPEGQAQPQVRGYTLPPEEYAEAVAYSRARYRLYFIGAVWGGLMLLVILACRLGPIFRNWAEGSGGRRRFLQALIFVPLLLVALQVLSLPPNLAEHWISLKYHQSVQGWGSWFWDWTKGLALGIVFGTLVVWILYGIIRRTRRWWFYFWLVSIPIVVFLIFISPYVIDPLFYQFEPLQKTDPELVTALEKVVGRAGMDIPSSRMFLMKASVKTNELNAYVTGLGASKRVVVWDTTIQKMTTSETVFVFGHEMGHYVLGHIWKGILFATGFLLVLFYLGYRGCEASLKRWGRRWGIRGAEDWASLPVLLLLLSVFSFAASPVANGFSRHLEHQADIYGLEVTHGLTPDSSQVAARAFQILGEVDLSDPDPNPFIEFWLYSHPSIRERIDFALHYDPWPKGEAPEFVK
jgi:Zn-dependent protease with chaperone function